MGCSSSAAVVADRPQGRQRAGTVTKEDAVIEATLVPNVTSDLEPNDADVQRELKRRSSTVLSSTRTSSSSLQLGRQASSRDDDGDRPLSSTPLPSPTHGEEIVLKVLVVGNRRAGKTAMLRRITRGVFDDVYQPTVGVVFSTRGYQVDQTCCRVHFWDVSGGALDGSDRVAARALEHELVHALLVVFDATDPDPVGGLQEWHSFVCNQVVFATPEPIVFAIAAKSDLALDLDNRLVGMNKALSWAQHTFGLSSAKGVGAEEAVEELVRTLCDDTEEL
eukprot:m.293087 g.293087  ORF g.293087 m.293087 type:complete len:278 (+) comp19490_c0_seq2:165-998(+)